MKRYHEADLVQGVSAKRSSKLARNPKGLMANMPKKVVVHQKRATEERYCGNRKSYSFVAKVLNQRWWPLTCTGVAGHRVHLERPIRDSLTHLPRNTAVAAD